MAIELRYSYDTLKTKVRGKYGLYMSKKMVTALHAYRDFITTKHSGTANFSTIGKAESALLNAWIIWSLTKEFKKTDSRTNGLLTALGVEMGAFADTVRESITTAFVLRGKGRRNPTHKQVPDVEVTDMTVPAYLDALDNKGIVYCVVLIDAFGGGDSQAAHGFDRCYGTDKSSVLENLQAVLDTANEHRAPILNVTMGEEKTWKSLLDCCPKSKVFDVVKPKQPLFLGDDRYVQKTLEKIEKTKAEVFVVAGWDANQCVAAAIFGVEQLDGSFVPGLVDLGVDVVTSRNLLGANLTGALESKWGWPDLGPSAPRAIGLTRKSL